jgi:hypothetical protein
MLTFFSSGEPSIFAKGMPHQNFGMPFDNNFFHKYKKEIAIVNMKKS